MKGVAFITASTGPDGRDEVSINVEEIASYRSHVVTSYSYQEWTLVSLKNGTQHDCRITKRDFEKKLREVAEVASHG
jgi:hypothetical protein